MYQSDTEMLFPSRVIPTLKDLRGAAWLRLVEEVAEQEDGEAGTLAFGLMMIRLNSCLSCHADSYRAMRGCTACAQQSIVRFRDDDEVLIKLYKKAEKDIEAYQMHRTPVEV